ncbi:seed maturation protein PM34, putative [Acanthamoeba castellanii str. Neff]|jgi:NAD(P)-dependent dehydrogenase (short-subunit alcohol dehydrogenase family)|uniref:Seed maturation protein PM34, putative n=1 Tax=Acanthamoeba castellanii (strain ATCC 30010 / Neff) TaxID=1257118 RepID=L8HID7_ACACF|nr:seed maturation protein PM34, putative [Acanthamoeba castellanii str. Neff]ELR24970.1 seed maturation protein PM34, putative [Acanthamoeba castellanii str. Neff]
MASQEGKRPTAFPEQMQRHMPGYEHEMEPAPQYLAPNYKGSEKLKDKVAIITGGDSGIGRSVSILYAREGADVVIVYLPEEQKDADTTKGLVEKEGRQCLCIPGDLKKSDFCDSVVDQTIKRFGKLDILVNNASSQWECEKIEDITDEQLETTFRTNIFSMFYMARASVKHMKEGSCIINTTSVTCYRGMKTLLDYSSTKGAITTFTYSLSQNLVERGIRVNGVAPGPIWTPLIPASFKPERVKTFGQEDCPMGRAGQPEEVAPCYVFLASNADSSYISGQVLHPNGGSPVHG